MTSRISTGHGDDGHTKALSGDAYSKGHPIMDSVGTLDELRAHVALLRVQLGQAKNEYTAPLNEPLLWLLHVFFVLGASLSDPLNKHPEHHQRVLRDKDMERLDQELERIEIQTPLPNVFILAAATPVAAQADIACTVARRLERDVARLKEQLPAFEAKRIQTFLNRLSDYLFILARHLDDAHHQAFDTDVWDG